MPDYKHIAGSASAAALGFIHGDIKGAKLGYDLYQKYSNMAPVQHYTPKRQRLRSGQYGHPTPQSGGRGRNTSLNPSRKRNRSGTYGRSASVSSSSSKKRQRSVGGGRLTAGANNSLNNATKYKKRGRIATRHLKTVKVSKKLRDKIKTVVQDKGTQGKRVQLWNDHFLMGTASTLPYRHFHFTNLAATALVTKPHVYFTPDQVVNSASIMFNLKPPVQNYELDPDTKNFPDTKDAVFDIKLNRVTYVFKNNSQRHYDFTFTVMTPKNNTDAVVSATIDDAIAADVASLAWQGSATVGPDKGNLCVRWQDSPTLKRNYKLETTLIKIDPGASTSMVVHGYTGRFNRKKSIKQDQADATVHWKYPKGDTKFVVMDVVPNMVAITSATEGQNYGGRFVQVAGTPGAGIIMEIKEEIIMDAPGIKPVANNRTVTYMENYSNSISTTNRTIGTQNPDNEGDGLIVPNDQ